MTCTYVLYAHEHAHRMLCVFPSYAPWACAWNGFKTFSGRFTVHAHVHGTFLENWGMRSASSMRICITCAGRMRLVCHAHMFCMLMSMRIVCYVYASGACAWNGFKTFKRRFTVYAHVHGTFF